MHRPESAHDPICQKKDEGSLGKEEGTIMSIPPFYKVTSLKKHTYTPTDLIMPVGKGKKEKEIKEGFT